MLLALIEIAPEANQGRKTILISPSQITTVQAETGGRLMIRFSDGREVLAERSARTVKVLTQAAGNIEFDTLLTPPVESAPAVKKPSPKE